MLGTVKWFDAKKGYGFLLNPEGKDIFVHFSSIESDGFRTLRDGEKVEFEPADGNKGLHALHVRRLNPPVRQAISIPSVKQGASTVGVTT